MNFTWQKTCELCPLHAQAITTGIPTRPADFQDGVVHGQALLVVGEAPGFEEDQEGTSWVGWSGKLLHSFLKAMEIDKVADVYLTNACRCRPLRNATPTKGQRNKCRPYLQADIDLLKEQYDRVIVLGTGATGACSLSGASSLSRALKLQGLVLENDTIFFATYHPAILANKRDPAKVHAIQSHLEMVVRYLRNEDIYSCKEIKPILAPEPPDGELSRVCVDIETYGILKGRDQSVFHPIKAQVVDGHRRGKQIITVSIAWDEGGKIRTGIFRWGARLDRDVLRRWFRKIREQRILVIGQNIKFDVIWLRFNDPYLCLMLDPRHVRLDDTMLTAFLLYEQQPEKGLKELCKLLGILDYSKMKVTGSAGNAISHNDQNLWYYNCGDTKGTLMMYDKCLELIRERYSESSNKLGPVCADLRNAILWECIDLESKGCTFNIPKLQRLHEVYSYRRDEAEAWARERGVKLSGKGSKKSKHKWLLSALDESGLIDDKRLKITEKQRDISVGKENISLVLENLPPDSPNAKIAEDIVQYQKHDKLVGSYTKKLLSDPRSGIVTRLGVKGVCYPTWYPMPSSYGNDDEVGGTIQGRFSARKPAIQTLARPPYPGEDGIEDCLDHRFRFGKFMSYDYGQAELRMGALWSGDPYLMDAYTGEEKDLHTLTTCTIFPELDPDTPDFKKKYDKERQLGKKTNFLVIYRGTAPVFQMSARAELGIDLSMEFCSIAIDRWYKKHSVFKGWQDRLIEQVAQQGYFELPTGWSRTFVRGDMGESTYIGEICNFPLQCTAVQLIQSAHFEILKETAARNMKSFVSRQVHDALYVEVVQQEAEAMDELVVRHMTNPPIARYLFDHFGREINIKVDRKVHS